MTSSAVAAAAGAPGGDAARRDPLAIPPEVKASIRVLVVDDERTLRESCASVLQMDGYNVTVIGRGEEARMPDRYRGMLDGAAEPGEVSALNVHAFYTMALAEAAGGGLDLELGDGTASLRVRA